MTMHISVDFDGVIATQDYPRIGRLMRGAKETLNKWYNEHTIIINTCRVGTFLDDCRHFLDISGIKYHYLNENALDLIEKYNNDTRKISADIYFDDKNAGGFMGWQRADDYVTWKSNRKPVIICIVGKSGSGKTHLAEYIESTFGVGMIESRTTRNPRREGETGHTFVTDEEFDAYKHEDKIAFTRFGDARYCCLHQDVKEENTYVLDENGLEYLTRNFSDRYDICSILVSCNEAERITRAGKERVARDENQFKMPAVLFDFQWHTDKWRRDSHKRSDDYKELHKFINKALGRGWC